MNSNNFYLKVVAESAAAMAAKATRVDEWGVVHPPNRDACRRISEAACSVGLEVWGSMTDRGEWDEDE